MKEGFILKGSDGFTLMEVLIAMFLFVVATVAIVGVSVLVSKTSLKVEKQVVAQAIANDTIEKLHGLPYSKVGEVPSGAVLQSNTVINSMGGIEYRQAIQQDQQEYVIITDVVPIDDPANGAVSGTKSLTNADYKTVRVQVNPTLGGVMANSANSTSVVSAATTVANWPPGACSPGQADVCSIAFPAPSSTFVFANPIQMRTFVNSLGLYAAISSASEADGRFDNGDATKSALCTLKGYSAVGSFTSISTSSTPYYRWNGSSFATVSSTSYIATLTCSSPLSPTTCSYNTACPASGNCADAAVPRGYTPNGARYLGPGDPTWTCS